MARHVAREVSILWDVPTPLNHNISNEFLHNKLTSVLNLLKPPKAPVPDLMFLELYSIKAKLQNLGFTNFYPSARTTLRYQKCGAS